MLSLNFSNTPTCLHIQPGQPSSPALCRMPTYVRAPEGFWDWMSNSNTGRDARTPSSLVWNIQRSDVSPGNSKSFSGELLLLILQAIFTTQSGRVLIENLTFQLSAPRRLTVQIAHHRQGWVRSQSSRSSRSALGENLQMIWFRTFILGMKKQQLRRGNTDLLVRTRCTWTRGQKRTSMAPLYTPTGVPRGAYDFSTAELPTLPLVHPRAASTGF